MMNRRKLLRFATACIFAASCLTATDGAWGYTPDSPEVKAMVQKALKYLQTASYGELGGTCLIGMAHYKNGAGQSHPKVAEAIEACRRESGSLSRQGSLYSPAIATIFLCEVDSQKYRPEIDKYIAHLMRVQKPHGGWGYEGTETGDTSQTQYGAMAIWTANQADVNVPMSSAVAVCNWLLRTQDPTGAWGYQGTDPGPAAAGRVGQTGVRHSMVVAGVGSLYVLADMLGMTASKEDKDTGLPPALKLIEQEDTQRSTTAGVNPALLRRGQLDGDRWFAQNYSISSGSWQYYYLYSLERYQSFRELVEGKTEAEPRWYNDGVNYLAKAQQADGSWQSSDVSPSVDTAFATLFLMRSTQKSIGKKVLSEGTLRGGRGLPTNTSAVRLVGNKVVSTEAARSVDEVLQLLEDPQAEALDNLMQTPEPVSLADNLADRDQQLARLRRLVSNPSYEARIVAVRALAQARDMDNVPVLIYALSDPDARVVREARDGLRFISRKFTGFGLADESTPEQRAEAQEKWKQWYRTVRPDAQFLD